MDSKINVGQWPRRSFEDLRLQTKKSLENCDAAYFFHYPSHDGEVIRQLHDQLAGFSRQAGGSFRVLVWGRSGDISHIHQYLSQYGVSLELHGVVATQDDLEWSEAHTDQDIWLETSAEHYCAPPYIPTKHFNCVLIMGDHRDRCLSQVGEYLSNGPYCLLVVDDQHKCSVEEGYHYLGGPVWRHK
jgi:hypothetical protein